MLRRNDSVLLQSELTALAREVDTLEQRLSEDLGSMRDEIELSMNDYRSDVREEQKVTEHHIQGINNRLTVMLGDTATELESLKMNVIWRGLCKYSMYLGESQGVLIIYLDSGRRLGSIRHLSGWLCLISYSFTKFGSSISRETQDTRK